MIDPTNCSSAQASALVEELARAGVSHAALSPGSRSTPVALALEREPTIEVAVILDERSAGFYALGAALASGRPAVVACTSGSAAANLHPAIVEADEAGVPLIALTSDRPPELRGIGAGQAIDQIKLFGDAVRLFIEAGSHDADDAGLLHYRAIAVRSIAAATGHNGRPGPVQLNLPWRDPLGPEAQPEDVTATNPLALEGRGDRPLTVPIPSRGPSDALVGVIAERIASAQRPLIVAGRNRNQALPAELRRLATGIGAPLLADPTSGLRFADPGGVTIVGAYDSIARAGLADQAIADRLAPDLILRFGDLPTSKPLRTWLGRLDDAEIVIDTPREWDDPSRTAGAVVAGDGAALASALAGTLGGEAADGFAAIWASAERAASTAIDQRLSQAEAITEPSIHRAAAAAYRDGDRCLLASSMPIRDHESFVPPRDVKIDVISNRGANGIDGLVSTAAGIAAASAAPTWAILGDLALAHDVGGLAVLAGAKVPLRLVVIDNGGGGIFDFLPQAEQVDEGSFERLFTTPSGLDIGKAAALYGIEHVVIESATEIAAVAARPGPVLIEARVDRSANVTLHRELHDAAAAAIAAAL